MTEKKIAVVTGASSGIGFAVCERLLLKGFKVYGLSRRGTVPDGCTGISADVTESGTVSRAIEDIISEEGHIDLLVAAAGYGISGPVEFTGDDESERQMNVNFLGQFRCIRAVLPYMRERGEGVIVSVSSVAGIMAIPYQSFYSASKAALNSLILSLRNEVRGFGVKVCAVLPGDTATGFTDNREKNLTGDSVYGNSGSAVSAMEKDERSGMSPGSVAGVICRAACAKNPAPMYIAGGKYKLFGFLFRILPARFSYWIIGKMYS